MLINNKNFYMKKVIFILTVLMLSLYSCTTVDSSEIGIKFHKFSASSQEYGGVEGTVRGFVFYNPFTESIFTYPTRITSINFI